MKKVFLGLLIVCAICMIPAMAAVAQASDGSSAIKDAILKSTTYADRDITYAGTDQTSHGSYTMFTTPDKSVYYINDATHEIERVDAPFDWKETKTATISRETAEKDAVAIVDKYSSAQRSQTGFNVVSSQLVDHGTYQEYVVEFAQVSDGIVLPNRALVLLNPANGKLLSYMSMNTPVTVSLTPELSKEDAMNAAIDQYPDIKVVSNTANLEVVYPEAGNQRLVYRITLTGEPVNGTMYGGYLAVDAIDGKIWYNSPFK
jgi:hypothetical protein